MRMIEERVIKTPDEIPIPIEVAQKRLGATKQVEVALGINRDAGGFTFGPVPGEFEKIGDRSASQRRHGFA